MFQATENNIPLQQIEEDFLTHKNVKLYILREDLNHPEIAGNKWRKLKYNLQEAKKQNLKTILTFGGSFSNHIAATAAACKEYGFNAIGVIRGEEVLPLNPTLQLAHDNGMLLNYVSRNDYRNKKEQSFLKSLMDEYGKFYLLPEGGSNPLAVKGCMEIINNIKIDYDLLCVASGTGGTIAGIIASGNNDKKILGFPALKDGNFLRSDIKKLILEYTNQFNSKVENTNWDLVTDYHFGGFAKIKPELVNFMKTFKKTHNILLDFIYTGKMFFGLYDMIKNTSQFDNKTIIVVHTGGTQGNKGFEDRFNITV